MSLYSRAKQATEKRKAMEAVKAAERAERIRRELERGGEVAERRRRIQAKVAARELRERVKREIDLAKEKLRIQRQIEKILKRKKKKEKGRGNDVFPDKPEKGPYSTPVGSLTVWIRATATRAAWSAYRNGIKQYRNTTIGLKVSSKDEDGKSKRVYIYRSDDIRNIGELKEWRDDVMRYNNGDIDKSWFAISVWDDNEELGEDN